MLRIARGACAAALSAICTLAWLSHPSYAQLPPPGGSLVVTITSPASGSTVSGTVPVSASVSVIGSLTVAGVQFKLDGANLDAEDTTAPYSIAWNTTGTSNGSHTLTAVARDVLGVRYTSNPVTVTVSNAPPADTTPPTVAITSPASGATVSGTITVTASASDNVGVAGVQFKVNGGNLGAEDTAAPYSVTVDTTKVPDGTYTLTAVARDAAGNAATSAPVTVTVRNAPPADTTPPAVMITSPANGATVSGTVTVTASASDNVGVVGVQFKVNGTNLGAEDATTPYSATWDTTAVTDGSHTLTAVARDAAGNTTVSSAVTVTVSNAPPADTTPPTVAITSPTSGATVSGTITVTASASDNVGVAGVQFKVNGGNLGAEDTAAPYAVTADTTKVPDGSYTLTATARDAAGNRTTSASVTVTVSNAPPADTTPPTVAITSPASGATVSGTVTVTANASDNVGVAGVQFQLDGVDAGAEDTTAPYSIVFDTTATSDGPHTITAVARDAAGNRTTSAPVTVTVSNTPPADTTPPTVAITSPGSGATVSGTITVSADASDNVGVAGVQFRLDGANLGAEDATAPYSTTWDTTTVADGSHTLTAVARDAAGNTTVSSAVTVTVSNAAPVPTVTRFEETDPSVTATAGWTVESAPRWSGGTAAFSATAGARASFAFTGKSVSWIGARGPQTGIARVFVDGILVGEMDTFAAAEEFQVVVFTAADLADASHTLTIEVTGTKNAAATGALIVVDAFDVSPSPPATRVSRLEETHASITFSAGWALDTSRPWSSGAAGSSVTAGARATLTFTGTSVDWISARGPQTGIARIFLDGALVSEVDTYSAAEELQAVVFTASGLQAAGHTLAIEVTGTSNPASTGALIVVDAFDVASPSPAPIGTRHEETDPSVSYAGSWVQSATGPWSGGTAAVSGMAGARASFTFTGTSVRWIGGRGPQAGIARVFVDGALAGEIDTYSTVEEIRAVVFAATGLTPGSHTVTIEVAGARNAAATDTLVMVDAFDVAP